MFRLFSGVFKNNRACLRPSQTFGLFGSQVNAEETVSQPEQELDKLYKTLIVEVRGHDNAVLKSYEWFVRTATEELSINLNQVSEPKVHHKRRTLLKSVHIYKKHRVQYEFRTYFRIFELKHLTGSTADTFLEYIQRNLPEGVSMKVTKHAIEKLPEHIISPETGSQSEENVQATK